MPIISIIVPVYKTEKYLRHCIDSILAQTFTDFECILVNDGSPDSCPAISDEYAKKDERITVIHQENKGVSAARNAGLDRAKGEWIGFVDSDDWCDKGMFQFLYDNAIKYDGDVSICDVRIVSNDERTRNTNYKKNIYILDGDEAIVKMFTPGTYGGYSFNKLVKMSIFNKHHIRYDETTRYMEDIFLFYTLFKYATRIVYAAVPYYNYVSNTQSVTRQLGLTAEARTGVSVLEKILSIETDKKIKKKVITALVIFERNLCLHYIKMRNIVSDDYLFLRKDIKNKIFYVLIDSSIPIKIKLLSWLVLYPKLFSAIDFFYKKYLLIS